MESACSRNEGIPKAMFEVGSKTIFIHDKTRGFDMIGGVSDGVSTLITEIWYPVFPLDVKAQTRQPDYGDYVFGNKAVHAQMMYDTTFFHAREIEPLYGTLTVQSEFSQKDLDQAVAELFHRKRNSYLDLPLADTGDSFPVVVSSHGDAGSRYNLETACEYLASHGYIVIAPDHTGNSPFSMVGMDPDLDPGSAVINEQGVYGETFPVEPFYGQTYQVFQPIPGTQLPDILKADQAVIQRVNDLRAILTKLEKMNAFGPFAGRIDLNRMGLMGKSFGGTTTLAGLELENRFKAGVAVVPASIPDLRKFFVDHLDGVLPDNRESALLEPDMGKNPAFTAMNKPCLIINCEEDGIIIRFNEAFNLKKSSRPTQKNTHPALYTVFNSTKAPVIWTMFEDADHSTCGVSGPYWWPTIKRNKYPRYFNPKEEYTLIHPKKAHKILKELCLNFFDLYLKEDKAVLEPLLTNKNSCLKMEHRNYI